MSYDKIGELLFMLLWCAPGLIVGVLAPLVDIWYGNTYLFGAFFDRTIYRDEHPFWFWLVEFVQIVIAAMYVFAVFPDLVGNLLKLL